MSIDLANDENIAGHGISCFTSDGVCARLSRFAYNYFVKSYEQYKIVRQYMSMWNWAESAKSQDCRYATSPFATIFA